MQQPVQPPAKKRHLVRWVVIGVVVVVVVGAIGANAGGGDGEDTASATTAAGSGTKAAAETTATTQAPTTTRVPKTTTTTEAPTTTTTEAPTTTTTMAPIELTGRGDDIVEVPPGPALLYITHVGSSNFAVKAFAGDGELVDLLVNEIGTYEGTHIYDLSEPETAKLEITADGNWTIEVKDIRAMRTLDCPGTLTGTGADVFLVAGDPSQAEIAHTGESNFAVWYYPVDGGSADLLVNEIGNYEGKKILPGPGVAVLEADGKWSFEGE